MVKAHGLTASLAGKCCDNADVESFFKTLKAELVHHEHDATGEEAGNRFAHTTRSSTIANESTPPWATSAP